MIQWIVSSSLLLVVLIGLRFLLRGRIKPKLQYALWALALARLVLPISFGSVPISVENTVEKAPLVQEMEIADQVTHFDYHLDGFATGYYTFDPAQDQTSDTEQSAPVTELFTHAEADRITHLRTTKGNLLILWVGGMVIMAVAFLVSNVVFALRLRKSRKLLEKGRLPIYVTEATETPCLFGLFRPAIYLTPAVAEEEHHRTYAIAHETTHYRHGDFVWSVLRSLCLIVHWYNPLVWWAAILSRADGEIACDEATISDLGEGERAEYGRVLIDLTCRKTTDLLRTATTMTGSAKGLKERIKMIAKRPKMAIYTLIAVLLVAAITVGCTFTGADKGKDPTDPTTENTAPTDPTETTDPVEVDYLQAITGTPLTEDELAYFTELFAHKGTVEKEEDINWYNLILSCGWNYVDYKKGFTVPEDVNLDTLFNNGFREISSPSNWTAEEMAFIQGFYPGYPENWGDIDRLPADRMNKVLQEYFGITLEQSNKVSLDMMYYFADTDCYFGTPAGAIGEQKVKMTAGKLGANGTVYLLCTTDTTKILDGMLLLAVTPAPEGSARPYWVQMCIEIKAVDDVASALRTSVHLPAAEEMAETGEQNSKYFLLRYLPNGEIMDGGYEGKPYTTDGMKMDYLYAIDDGVAYSISGGVVGRLTWAKDAAQDYIYFVRKDEPKKIWRTDLHGQNPTVVYESQYGDITFLSCVNGWLSIIENNNRASLLDMKNGKMTVLLEVYQVEQFSYDAANFRVFWRGRLNESDGEDNSYYYYLKTNEYIMLQPGTTGVPVTPET